MQPREALFRSFMVTYCSGEMSFSRLKMTKNDLNDRHVRGEVVHISIRCIKSDKTETRLRQILQWNFSFVLKIDFAWTREWEWNNVERFAQ